MSLSDSDEAPVDAPAGPAPMSPMDASAPLTGEDMCHFSQELALSRCEHATASRSRSLGPTRSASSGHLLRYGEVVMVHVSHPDPSRPKRGFVSVETLNGLQYPRVEFGDKTPDQPWPAPPGRWVAALMPDAFRPELLGQPIATSQATGVRLLNVGGWSALNDASGHGLYTFDSLAKHASFSHLSPSQPFRDLQAQTCQFGDVTGRGSPPSLAVNPWGFLSNASVGLAPAQVTFVSNPFYQPFLPAATPAPSANLGSTNAELIVRRVRQAQSPPLNAFREMFLTMDDGPTTFNADIQDVLEHFGIPCIMFHNGAQIQLNDPDHVLLRREVRNPRITLGWHTGRDKAHWYMGRNPHAPHLSLTVPESNAHLREGVALLNQVHQQEGQVWPHPHLFRFPYLYDGGEDGPALQHLIAAAGYDLVSELQRVTMNPGTKRDVKGVFIEDGNHSKLPNVRTYLDAVRRNIQDLRAMMGPMFALTDDRVVFGTHDLQFTAELIVKLHLDGVKFLDVRDFV